MSSIILVIAIPSLEKGEGKTCLATRNSYKACMP
jgi:hypothetical protein